MNGPVYWYVSPNHDRDRTVDVRRTNGGRVVTVRWWTGVTPIASDAATTAALKALDREADSYWTVPLHIAEVLFDWKAS